MCFVSVEDKCFVLTATYVSCIVVSAQRIHHQLDEILSPMEESSDSSMG